MTGLTRSYCAKVASANGARYSECWIFRPFFSVTISGMVSPYAIRLLVDDRATSGRNAGHLFFVSTFGSAAGTILTSFYLVLWLEVNQILITMIVISLALGLAAWLVPKNRRDE